MIDMNKEINVLPLITKIQKGDRQALESLCRSWYPRVYRYALRFTGDEEMAKEASQLTFISVTKGINNLRDPSSYTPWLFRIVANHCRNLHKSKRYHEPEEVLHLTMQTNNNPHRQMERNERIAQVKKALMKIPAEQREVIIMKEYEGLKFREIAAILETSENTVKSRMYYGLNALKKTLTVNKDKIYNEAS
ncbi:MAG: RNA polymerase sigma factor [Bacteroidia bacterium]|nr:RNA polymerase sigma factor [Bacteroidia bacterium]